MKSILLSILISLFLFVSCDKKDDKTEEDVGALGQKCYPAGSCNEGLICEDGTCVKDDTAIDEDTDVEDSDTDVPDTEEPDTEPLEDLCDPNPCTMLYSTGECNTEGDTYVCGCKENYTWNSEDKECDPDTRKVECTNEIPENASYSGENTDGMMEQIWEGTKWIPYDDRCKWECDEDFFKENDECINTRIVVCDSTGDYPDNSEVVEGVDLEITYTTDGGWSDPGKCDWKCIKDYFKDDESCINSKMVDCTPNPIKPANSVSVIEKVEVFYTSAGGWTLPSVCTDWACDTDYFMENDKCINTKMVECAENPGKPANSIDVPELVEATYTTESGWVASYCSDWVCGTDFFKEGETCINRMTVQCDTDNDNPPHSFDVVENVEIKYTTEGGWEPVPLCEWECNTDFAKEETCINSKDVNCLSNPDRPFHSVNVVTLVQITYTTAGGWETADPCTDWQCDVCFILSSSGEECDFQTTVYVKHDAEGEQTGHDWNSALKDLSKAIFSACEGQELWVAAGTYLPTVCFDGFECGQRNLYFALRNDVAIYGGFDGVSYVFADRDWETYATILSGEFGVENAYHVIYNDDLAELNETAILDGFTIKGGNADGAEFPDNAGGGMFNGQTSKPTIRNCIFSGNSAVMYGGAIYNHSGAGAVIENTVFINNSALEGSGSAIYNDGGTLIVSGTQFIANYAFERGAVYVDNGTAEIDESLFINNISETGGGAFVSNESSVTIQRSFFEGNETGGNGGAILNRFNSFLTLVNSVFKGNYSSGMGGAVANFMANSFVLNCTFNQNQADKGGSAINGGIFSIINSLSWGNHADSFADEILLLPEGTEVDGLLLEQGYYKIAHSNIAGCGYSGVGWNVDCGIDSGGNIDTDPMFVGVGDDPLMLAEGSPSINAGDNVMILDYGILTDILGNPRIGNGIVDMGAYESPVATTTVNYFTAWATPHIHYDNGIEWTTPPGVLMTTDGTWAETTVTWYGEYLEFVFNDGGSTWDNPPGGGNYTTSYPEIWVKDGIIHTSLPE